MTTKRRRTRGSGSQDKTEGRYRVRVSFGFRPDGKRDRRSFYGTTLRETQQKANQARIEYEQGVRREPGREQTVAAFLDDWLTSVHEPNVRYSTYQRSVRHVRLHLAPGLGHHRLSALTPQDVQAFLKMKSDQGLSPRTVGHHRATLRNALNVAVKWNLITRNAAAAVSPPRVPDVQIEPPTPSEVHQLLDQVASTQWSTLYATAAGTGMRLAEVLGLTWDEVDLDQAVLAVRHTLVREDREFKLAEPKTSRSRRTVPIPAFVVEALRERSIRQKEQRLAMGSAWTGSDLGSLVFTRDDGQPLYPTNVSRRFAEHREVAGLRHFTFHQLRHAAASIALSSGVPLSIVSDSLGHSSVRVTKDVYGHISDQAKRETADALQKAFAG